MNGQIFISYRREDASYPAGRLYDNLHSRFPQNEIFMDVDSIKPGIDFIETIEERVGSCDVLVAVIGKGWLSAADEKGRRRLDNPEDFVRVEVGTALTAIVIYRADRDLGRIFWKTLPLWVIANGLRICEHMSPKCRSTMEF